MPFKLNYKKFILLILIFAFAFLTFFLIKVQISPFLKAISFFLLLIFFLSLLTIFEITNSLIENLFFWLIISLLLSYFYLYAGLILFFLALLKILSQESILKNSLKIPLSLLVSKNYSFLLLAIFLIWGFYFYQNLILKESLPLTFLTFQKITGLLDKLFSFFRVDFSLKERTPELVLKFLEKYKLPPLLLSFLNKELPQESLEKFIYDSVQKSWQDSKLRKIYLLSFLSVIFLIFYPLLRAFSFLIGWFSLLLYYLYLKINFVKINFQSINKEVLEL